MKKINYIGKKFGRLTVIKVIGSNKYGHKIVECICNCGNKWEAIIYSLIKGNTLSCGCIRKEKPNHITHNFSKTKFYDIFCSMKERIFNPNNKAYKNYGGRGIKILWNNFEEFHKDMYQPYLEHVKQFGESNTSIERIDNNGHYSKHNCRWATRQEQGKNRRNNRLLTINGKTKVFQQWCNEFNLPKLKVKDRIDKLHWTPEEALGLIPRVRKPNHQRSKL